MGYLITAVIELVMRSLPHQESSITLITVVIGLGISQAVASSLSNQQRIKDDR